MGVITSSVAGSTVSAIGSYISNAMTASSQDKANKLNYEMQNKQLDYQKNAYSYAAADRMRAGLSPLDSEAMSSPSLGGAQTGVQFGDLGASIAAGSNAGINAYLATSQQGVNNAQSAKTTAETQGILLENQKILDEMQGRIDLMRQQYEELRNKNSSYAEELEKRIQQYDAQIQYYQAQIKNLNEVTPAQVSNLQSQTRVNNARAAEDEQTIKTADALGIPAALVRTFDTKDAQSMLVYNALTAQAQSAQNSGTRLDYEAAYRDYVQSWHDANDNLTSEIKKWNARTTNTLHDRDEQERLSRERRELGSKPLTFKAFLKRVK